MQDFLWQDLRQDICLFMQDFWQDLQHFSKVLVQDILQMQDLWQDLFRLCRISGRISCRISCRICRILGN